MAAYLVASRIATIETLCIGGADTVEAESAVKHNVEFDRQGEGKGFNWRTSVEKLDLCHVPVAPYVDMILKSTCASATRKLTASCCGVKDLDALTSCSRNAALRGCLNELEIDFRRYPSEHHNLSDDSVSSC